MAIFYIGKENKDFTQLQGTELYYKAVPKRFGELFSIGNKSILYTSSKPICKRNNRYEEYLPQSNDDLEQILRDSQNNFCGFQYFQRNNESYITIASSRLGRAHMYFSKTQDGYYFSNDIREIIPFTSRRLNYDAAYSIIKFGNTPEYITCIQDIFAVPVSSYLTISLEELEQKNAIYITDFRPYFHLHYSFDGGNIKITENMLGEIFDYVVKQDFILPISGGIDSSLMNYMVSERIEKHYPAFFIAFGNDDSEKKYAIEAVKNTKAELEIYTMFPKDFVAAFNYQSENLIQPIGEASAISMSNMFRSFKYKNINILDGTLADGCYGSRNYNVPLFAGINDKSHFEMRAAEQVVSFLQLHNLPLKDKFCPRDSMIDDKFLRFMNIYVGPLSNTLFKDAGNINVRIYQYWDWYYSLITSDDKDVDEWMKYSVFKMANYAANNNTAKTYDICGASNDVIYPFMWLEVLTDQGKYHWTEKSQNDIVKYPLKKIIEKYATKEFIYRKKAGLQTSVSTWMKHNPNKEYIIEMIKKQGSIAEAMLGRRNLLLLLNTFTKESHHQNITNLVVSFALIESWCDHNGVSA